jgi:hypothetical protein
MLIKLSQFWELALTEEYFKDEEKSQQEAIMQRYKEIQNEKLPNDTDLQKLISTNEEKIKKFLQKLQEKMPNITKI